MPREISSRSTRTRRTGAVRHYCSRHLLTKLWTEIHSRIMAKFQVLPWNRMIALLLVVTAMAINSPMHAYASDSLFCSQFVEPFGYICAEYKTQTAGGFILTAHRIGSRERQLRHSGHTDRPDTTDASIDNTPDSMSLPHDIVCGSQVPFGSPDCLQPTPTPNQGLPLNDDDNDLPFLDDQIPVTDEDSPFESSNPETNFAFQRIESTSRNEKSPSELPGHTQLEPQPSTPKGQRLSRSSKRRSRKKLELLDMATSTGDSTQSQQGSSTSNLQEEESPSPNPVHHHHHHHHHKDQRHYNQTTEVVHPELPTSKEAPSTTIQTAKSKQSVLPPSDSNSTASKAPSTQASNQNPANHSANSTASTAPSTETSSRKLDNYSTNSTASKAPSTETSGRKPDNHSANSTASKAPSTETSSRKPDNHSANSTASKAPSTETSSRKPDNHSANSTASKAPSPETSNQKPNNVSAQPKGPSAVRDQVSEEFVKGRPPVLLMHQEFFSGESWFQFTQPADRLLPFLLLDAGFDVWVGHERATFWGHDHATLQPNEKSYWNWTWDEHAKDDVPAFLQLVNNLTDMNVHYVGISQSATVGAAAATMPDSARLMRSLTLIGPTIYRGNTSSIMLEAWAFLFGNQMDQTSWNVGYQNGAFNFSSAFPVTSFNGQGPLGMALATISGPNCCLGSAMVSFANGWDGTTSFKNLLHYQQGVRTNTWRHFDYNSSANNTEVYGVPNAPDYHPEDIPPYLPVFVIYGGQDTYSPPSGTKRFLSRLNGPSTSLLLPEYAHYDLAFSVNRTQDVFLPILQFLERQQF